MHEKFGVTYTSPYHKKAIQKDENYGKPSYGNNIMFICPWCPKKVPNFSILY